MPEKLAASSSRDIAPQSDVASSSPQPPSEYALERRSARRAGVRWRRASRWTGLLIFALGVALLAFVFSNALGALKQFSQPDYLSQQFNRIAGDTIQSSIQAAVVVFGSEFLRVLYLLILGFIASALAARGIQFFAASESVIDEAVVPED
jgi:succinate dehydrogenase hydrophobic anchor subunit